MQPLDRNAGTTPPSVPTGSSRDRQASRVRRTAGGVVGAALTGALALGGGLYVADHQATATATTHSSSGTQGTSSTSSTSGSSSGLVSGSGSSNAVATSSGS